MTEGRGIKYRQPIFADGKFLEWHYWGFIKQPYGLIFAAPITGHKSMEEIREESNQFIGVKDKTGKEFCLDDIITKNGRYFSIIEYESGGYYAIALPGKYRHSGLYHISMTTKEYYIVGNKMENPEYFKDVKP